MFSGPSVAGGGCCASGFWVGERPLCWFESCGSLCEVAGFSRVGRDEVIQAGSVAVADLCGACGVMVMNAVMSCGRLVFMPSASWA